MPAWRDAWRHCHRPGLLGGMQQWDWPEPGGYAAQENLTVEMFDLMTEQYLASTKKAEG